jgi:hypothetical protein
MRRSELDHLEWRRTVAARFDELDATQRTGLPVGRASHADEGDEHLPR